MRAKISIILTMLVLAGTHLQAAESTDTISSTAVVDVQGVSKACKESPTQLTWFYKPPKNTTMSSVIAHHENYVLTKGDEKFLAQIHNAGERPVLQYLKFDALSDPCFQAKKAKGSPCSCSKDPRDNQVGWLKTDICEIRDKHPDWFLRDKSGNLLYWNDFVMMDPGNAGWREFWLSRAKSSMQQKGWDGVFIDNMTTRFGVHSTNFVSLQKYSTVKAYQDAVVGFINYARNSYFTGAKKKIFANISVRWGDNAVYLRYMDYLSGSMDEFWAYPRSGYYSVQEWQARLERAKGAVNKGKDVMLVSQGTQTDLKRQLFGFASYLLVASPTTYFRYTSDTAYSKMWLYDNYKLRLGTPTGAYTRNGNTWSRTFSNGKVSVNPETRQASIILFDADGC
jgi:hypothetical protein